MFKWDCGSESRSHIQGEHCAELSKPSATCQDDGRKDSKMAGLCFYVCFSPCVVTKD